MLSRRILKNHKRFLKNPGKQYTFSPLIPCKTMAFYQDFLEKFAQISVDIPGQPWKVTLLCET